MRIRELIRPILYIFCRIFYEKKYLSGRHFSPGYIGYVWALRSIFAKNILRLAVPRPWPTALSCVVANEENIIFHPDDMNNFQSPGVYFQNYEAKIFLGKGVYIAPNVGFITGNHDVFELDKHLIAKDINIGDECWIGMNSVILPGVILGKKTIVAAGAVVTKSFPNGYIIVGGVPAKIIKVLNID